MDILQENYNNIKHVNTNLSTVLMDEAWRCASTLLASPCENKETLMTEEITNDLSKLNTYKTIITMTIKGLGQGQALKTFASLSPDRTALITKNDNNNLIMDSEPEFIFINNVVGYGLGAGGIHDIDVGLVGGDDVKFTINTIIENDNNNLIIDSEPEFINVRDVIEFTIPNNSQEYNINILKTIDKMNCFQSTAYALIEDLAKKCSPNIDETLFNNMIDIAMNVDDAYKYHDYYYNFYRELDCSWNALPTSETLPTTDFADHY